MNRSMIRLCRMGMYALILVCVASPVGYAAPVRLAILPGEGERAPAGELTLRAQIGQEEFMVDSLMRLSLRLAVTAPLDPPLFLVHSNHGQLGSQSCFKVKCFDADGRELPIRLPDPRPGLSEVVNAQKTDMPPQSINLNSWFRPPPGGPYRVVVYYEWTDDVPKHAPHWKGRTNSVEVHFRVRRLNYGTLGVEAQQTVDRLLERLNAPNPGTAMAELEAMGMDVLPALHDALAMQGLDRRRALLRILAKIHAPASIPHILSCPASDGGLVSLSMKRAKEEAVAAYGEQALPYLIEAIRGGSREAEPMLARLGPAAVEPLLALLQSDDKEHERWILGSVPRLLAGIGDERARPVLERLAQDKPAYERQIREAIQTLEAQQKGSPVNGRKE